MRKIVPPEKNEPKWDGKINLVCDEPITFLAQYFDENRVFVIHIEVHHRSWIEKLWAYLKEVYS